ncbi:MAG: hypothetical protein LBQ77_08140 [Treponema sp.]|jgi:hypothetical protein|nr:hypothetical protein [Treponema sp.]
MDEGRHGYLEAAFGKINKNINKLFAMKDETVGWWIFESHKYTSAALLNSSEYERIQSTAEKIASDISNWEQNGQLDMGTKRVYNTNRDLLENRIERLQDAIKNREQTWWDSVKEFFSNLWNFVIKILPKFVNPLLKMIDKTGLLDFVPFGKELKEKMSEADSKVRIKFTPKEDKFIDENE